MRPTNRAGERLLTRRSRNEMDVIGHETVPNHLQPGCLAVSPEQVKVHRATIVHEKHVLTVVAAMRYVMRYLRYNDPRYPCHNEMTAPATAQVKKKWVTVPYFSVMRYLRYNDSRYSCHARMITSTREQVNKIGDCPRFPDTSPSIIMPALMYVVVSVPA